MKAAIEKIDFDNAIAKPFQAATCLLAQAAMRLRLESAYTLRDASPVGKELMQMFDLAYGPRNREDPVDWKTLIALRKSLPIEIELP